MHFRIPLITLFASLAVPLFALCAQAQSAAVSMPSSPPSGAAAVDPATATATQQTQTLLRDAAARDKVITTPDAKAADKQVKDLMGSDTQALYELAADILPSIVNDGGGDSTKIQVSMDQLAKDPASLESKLTPEQLARIKNLAKRAESRQPSSSTPH